MSKITNNSLRFGATVLSFAFAVGFGEQAVSQDSVESGPPPGMSARMERLLNREDLGHLQIGLGPAVAVGLASDQIMYNVNLGYNRALSSGFTGKIFGDLNLGSGSDPSRFITTGIGLDYYPTDQMLWSSLPYIGVDGGYGFTRNSDGGIADAPTVGAGAGLKFAVSDLLWDINLHYTVLMERNEDQTPSVLGLRAALNY